MVIDCESPYDLVTTPGIAIITPNYPNGYASNLSCQVTLSFDDRVSIEFESFDLSYRSVVNHTCDIDWLEVYDGNSSNSDLIRPRTCGSYFDICGEKDNHLESTGKSMTLVFRSQYESHRLRSGAPGFKIMAYQGMT